MPKIKVNLSTESLDAALLQIEAYKQKIQDAPQNVAKILSDYGKEEIEKNIATIQDKDGNYLATAGSYSFGEVGFAFMEGEKAAFLEFGTGISGKESPHPKSDEAGWQYNSGSTINKRTGDWSYWDPVRHRHVHTKGIPAQMTVLRAAIAMRRRLREAGKEAMK